MAFTFDLRILLTIAQNTLTFLSGRLDKKKDSIAIAHKAINSAFIKTYDYLRNKEGSYRPNVDLANAWNDASASVMRIDQDLGEQLYNKSRFWLDPQLFQNLNRENEIIELGEIVDEMEKLRNTL